MSLIKRPLYKPRYGRDCNEPLRRLYGRDRNRSEMLNNPAPTSSSSYKEGNENNKEDEHEPIKQYAALKEHLRDRHRKEHIDNLLQQREDYLRDSLRVDNLLKYLHERDRREHLNKLRDYHPAPTPPSSEQGNDKNVCKRGGGIIMEFLPSDVKSLRKQLMYSIGEYKAGNIMLKNKIAAILKNLHNRKIITKREYDMQINTIFR